MPAPGAPAAVAADFAGASWRAGSCQSGGRKRSAALGTFSTESRVSVVMRTFAVMPGTSARSAFCADTTTT